MRVRLGQPFTRFVLPEQGTPEVLRKALKASLKLLDVAPDVITVPLFASVWRSAVGGADFSLHLVGPTGAGKSELAALVQQHWGGDLNARALPASWSGTANANEALAFLAKDAVLVVDDFNPKGSQYDIQRKHQEADRLLRGQGNSSGRTRMRADTSLRPPKPPRGLILSTGEDVPRGESLQARLLLLAVSPEMVNWKRLSRRQKDAAAGLYATALAGFIERIAGGYDQVRTRMKELYQEYRAEASASDLHRRTPGIVADLQLGMRLFTQFARRCGALTDEEVTALLKRSWAALGEVTTAQLAHQRSSEPTQRFLDLLNAALAAGKAHVASVAGMHPPDAKAWGWRKEGDRWQARGDRVGWVDGGSLYLEPEVAYAVVQGMAQAGGEPLAISSQTLRKRLHEKDLLVSVDKKRDRLVVRKMLEGKQRTVLHLRAKALGAVGLAGKPANG